MMTYEEAPGAPDSGTRWADDATRSAIDAAVATGIAAIDLTGRQVFVNDAFCRMVGWTREELIGATPPFVYWPAAESAAIESAFARVFDGTFPPEGTRLWFQRRDGSRFYALVIASPYYRSGAVAGWVGTVIDVSKFRQQAIELQAEKSKLELVLRNGGIGVWEWDHTTDHVVYDSEWLQAFGFNRSADQATSGDRIGILHPDDQERVRQAMIRYLSGEAPTYDCEFRAPGPAGQWVWILSQGFAVERDPSGRPLRTFGTHKNIDRRKRVELENETRRSILQDAQAAAHLGHAVLELETGVITWSDELYRILAASPETLPATRDGLVLRLSGHTDCSALLSRPESLAEFEASLLSEDGCSREVLVLQHVQRDAQGMPVRLIATVQDVTERRQIDTRMRQSERLEALGNLSSGIAHDFNNLLSVIVGALEQAMPDCAGNPEVQELLDTALQAALSGAARTRALLTMAQRRPGQSTVEDLNGRLRHLLPLLQRSVGSRIRLRQRMEEEVLRANVDLGQFDSALVNLVVNARDAMPQGGEIEVSTRIRRIVADEVARSAEIAPGIYAEVEVRDEGEGMSEAILARVLDPYFTTKESSSGTGLGLPMVYGFCRAAGGGLLIDSQVGQGTTVRLLLPLADTGAEPTATEADAAPNNHRGTRILVVEDNEQLSDLVMTLFTAEGFDATSVASSEEAMRHLDANRTDIVFSDVMLSGDDSGVDLARWIAKHHPQTRVVLTSGINLDPADQVEGITFLPKPYRLHELLEALARATSTPPHA